eukprot:14153193-Alexandrium_andersonii.AAC.1
MSCSRSATSDLTCYDRNRPERGPQLTGPGRAPIRGVPGRQLLRGRSGGSDAVRALWHLGLPAVMATPSWTLCGPPCLDPEDRGR